MKTLYFVRHGQTLFNKLHKIQGWCDSPLTELGRHQASVTSHFFETEGIKLESAYCSTSERAVDTLEQITRLPYHRTKELKECNFGVFESSSEALFPIIPFGDFFVQYGGESELQAQQRIVKALTNIMLSDPNQIILAVSHGTIAHAFVDYWQDKNAFVLENGIPNGCILKFEFNPDQLSFKLIAAFDPNEQ